MSFDLRLVNGDLALETNADLAIVSDGAKLIQDVIKFVTTSLGSNKFQPQIGSLISERLIGKTLDAKTTISTLQSSVQEALNTLQRLQKQQSFSQFVSPAETIVSIKSIEVTRDNVEPRQLNVILKLLAADGNLIGERFTMILF